MAVYYPDSSLLAGKLLAKSIQKNKLKFSDTMNNLYEYYHPLTKKYSPLVSKTVYDVVNKYKYILNEAIKPERDFNFDFFGLKTLMRGYLMKMGDTIVETPQYMYMRVAIGIHGFNIEKVIETYDLLSQGYFTHATPTLFNAGTPKPQMSSCFLVQMTDDSIEGIYDTQKICAMISKYAGGIGLSVHNIRASGTYIAGTNGKSNGLIPMLKVYNETAKYVDQGGGKRKGSFAIYLGFIVYINI
jgi:ribonucleoside-diphosphate reductase alpha chain